MASKPPKQHFRVKGVYRILNMSVTGRPIYVIHSVYKKLLTDSAGYLDLAGNPVAVDIEFNIEFEQSAFWKGKAVEKLRDLDTYPIKGLAPGLVNVNGLHCPFLFYGNCWFMLAQTHLVNDELVMTDEQLSYNEADGQRRFTAAIDKMEKNARYDQPGIVTKKVRDTNNYRERLGMRRT